MPPDSTRSASDERFRDAADGLSFFVRLTPKGGRDAIEGWATGADGTRHLKARVSAVPENGKANAALLALLAKTIAVPKSALSIAGGETARLKRIVARGEARDLRARLSALGDKA